MKHKTSLYHAGAPGGTPGGQSLASGSYWGGVRGEVGEKVQKNRKSTEKQQGPRKSRKVGERRYSEGTVPLSSTSTFHYFSLLQVSTTCSCSLMLLLAASRYFLMLFTSYTPGSR